MWAWPVTMDEWQDTCHWVMRGSHLHVTLSFLIPRDPPQYTHRCAHTHIHRQPPLIFWPITAIDSRVSSDGFKSSSMTPPPLCTCPSNNNKATVNMVKHRWCSYFGRFRQTGCKLHNKETLNVDTEVHQGTSAELEAACVHRTSRP